MYSSYRDQEELEDELYRDDDDDTEGSEVNSELEFKLYSQLHYSFETAELEEQVDGGESEDRDEMDSTGDGVELQKDTFRQLLHPIDKLSKDPKGHTEPGHNDTPFKQKRQKADPKGQTSVARVFQEIIVIKSGSEVTSTSEGDMDEGVCALKCPKSKSRPLQYSTPAQRVTQKRKRSPSLDSVVIVHSDNSEPGLEEPESNSDSDTMEHWMILGRGKQDGDQSIILNLEEDSDSNTDGNEDAEVRWSVSNKDREAQIHNRGGRQLIRPMSNRYYMEKKVTCRNCNKTGHLSKNCPNPKKLMCCFLCGTRGHCVSDCPNKYCNNCGVPGHLYEACSERAYWHKECHRCGMIGHFFDVCPEIWRQYHVTTKTGPPEQLEGNHSPASAYCYNCSRKGHFGHACIQRRMFSGIYPSTTLISHYDTVKDIKRRNHRIRWKFDEHKETARFPSGSQTPSTSGPPKKKWKTCHHSNNHQPNHKSHQTPNNHIRFTHDQHGLKTKAAHQHKPQLSGSPDKKWKPKREVPATRGPLPPAKPKKLVFDEAEMFPRGGGNGDKIKKKKTGRMGKVRTPQPGEPLVSAAHAPDRLFGSGMAKKKRRINRTRERERRAAERANAEMYPTDENLFCIKQRKAKR